MNLSMHNQALLRGILVGAVVLSGASGCSRSDRAGAGRDTTQSGAVAVTPSDTQAGASAAQPSAGAATQSSGDTAMTTSRDTARATAQTPTSRQPSTPSNRRVRPDTAKSGEEAVSGYRGMERDSSVSASPDTTSAEVTGTGAASPLDSAGVTSDYALTADTGAAGYSEMATDTSSAAQRGDTADTTGSSEMARDTSSAAGRGDTAAVAVTDTTEQAESDTANIQVQMDTTTAQAQADTTTAVHTDTVTVATADSADTASATSEQAAAQAASADTLQDHTGRIRPPEDSTEIRGNVTTDNAVTGIDAVSLTSRAGARCVVKDDSSDVWWDMADSPAALNPCGTGTMTLSLVRTGEK